MRFSFRSRRPIPDLHIDRDAAVQEPIDLSAAIPAPDRTRAAFIDEAAEMERVKVAREIEVQERKFE